MSELKWMPSHPAWDAAIQALRDSSEPKEAWNTAIRLAGYRIDFLETARLDRNVQTLVRQGRIMVPGTTRIKLALLGSSTLKHLIPAIRVAGLRRGLWIDVFEGDYGQYLQELLNAQSSLHAFAPQFVLFSFDASHLLEISHGEPEAALDRMQSCWSLANRAFSCTVIQQTALPVFPDCVGSNEHRMPDSPQTFLEDVNQQLTAAADVAGLHLLAVQKYAARDGVSRWHDPALWLRTRQEIHPEASTTYGELAVRLIAAQLGRSRKCLVLDLDNTLWGGVIGDDGLHGISLGPGTPSGEAFQAFQRYILRLKSRGIILAVCSKNDETNALSPFNSHSGMVLQRSDIACFVANWQDKASNLRQISGRLNIGTDALVFVDDNPFERELVRQEMPEVAVPEMPQDPALYVDCLSQAGYFEALTLTADDRGRSAQYQVNTEREVLRASVTDLDSYLSGLEMELLWRPFDEVGLQRIVQLINKTNQFNVTTRRYSEAEVRSLMTNQDAFTWQITLKDRFGDNGMIALVIALQNEDRTLRIDTWLMSCRVLGRQVEEATLNLVVEGARQRGATQVIGEYRPTAKNGMVSDLYGRLGFSLLDEDPDGNARWSLSLDSVVDRTTHIRIIEEQNAAV